MDLAYIANMNLGSSSQEKKISEACIANISPLERRKRSKFAVCQLITTLVVLGVLFALDLHPLWRLPLFFLFSASTISYFQALDTT